MPTGQGNTGARFLEWFKTNEANLFSIDKDRERTFARVGTEMHKLSRSLTLEFGPVEEGKREFVISADGPGFDR